MTVPTYIRKRLLAAVGLTAVLAPLAGCQNRKIVARINDAPVNDEEYQDAVSRVKATDFQQFAAQQIQTDAGGVGLITSVKDKLLEKLAIEKKALPTNDEVKRYQDYLTRTNPAVSSSLAAGQLTKDQLTKLLRDNMIRINLGSNNATIPEADIQKAFKDNPTQYNYPEIVGLRAAPVPTEAEGIQVINQIKQTGDFASAAAKYAPGAGTVRYIIIDPLPPGFPQALKDALAPLKDGQVVSTPVKIQAQGAPGSNMLVVQLVKRMPKGEASLADAHEAIRERKLAETQPQLLQHSEEVINNYNQSQKVEVYIERYADVVKQALKPPITPPGMMGAAPGSPRWSRPGRSLRRGSRFSEWRPPDDDASRHERSVRSSMPRPGTMIASPNSAAGSPNAGTPASSPKSGR